MTTMTRRCHDLARVTIVGVLAAAAALQALAQDQPAAQETGPRRLRGVLDKDEAWSGAILITDDLTIQCTVTVEPGTIIEFAATSGAHPRLVVGSRASLGGRLLMQGTAERPITIRTRPQTEPGSIVVNVRSRVVSKQTTEVGIPKLESTQSLPSEVVWRHVRLENLGYGTLRRQQDRDTKLVEPAVTFNAIGDGHTVRVTDCTLVNCTRLAVRAADGAKIAVADNRFDSAAERVSVEITGAQGGVPAASVAIGGNLASAAISVSDSASSITDNVLVGLDAAIVVKDDGSAETRVAGNYVHNTADEDDGRYGLNCENPNAVIADNIIRGGTACVLTGSRRMFGNVLIGAGRLKSRYVKNARTHQLVQALPTGAAFERNLLMGPAYSLLVPQPLATQKETEAASGPTIIRHNLFDGFDESNRAIHLNALGRTPATIAALNNVFVRLPTLIYDEGRSDNTVTFCDYNAAAPPPPRPFDQVRIKGVRQGDAGWGSKDVQRAEVAQLGFVAAPKTPPPDSDADLMARKVTVEQLRRRFFDAYRPSASSPLVGAGRGENAADTARPSIGPT